MAWMQLGRVKGLPSSVTGSLPLLAGIRAASCCPCLHVCVAPQLHSALTLPVCLLSLEHASCFGLLTSRHTAQLESQQPSVSCSSWCTTPAVLWFHQLHAQGRSSAENHLDHLRASRAHTTILEWHEAVLARHGQLHLATQLCVSRPE